MDKRPDKSLVNKPHSVASELVIDEVLQSIERVDREIQRFYEIHGTELKVISDKQSEFRRG